MSNVKVQINGIEIEVPKGTTVLHAAEKLGFKIPKLCYLEEIDHQVGACRVCLVDVDGRPQTSCTFPVYEGMKVKTNTPEIRKIRKTIVELLLASGNHDCNTCQRNRNCELQALAEGVGIDPKELLFDKDLIEKPQKGTIKSVSITRNNDRCVLCGRCISICDKVQTVHALDFTNRGKNTLITNGFRPSMEESSCILCGQCTLVCPVGALVETDYIDPIWDAINDPEKHVIVQTAPAIRAVLGEEFGLEPGSRVTGKMVTALRMLGFDKVFDTNFAADLTIMEEGNELLHRMNNGGKLPLITSCSPGWIKFCETFYPEALENVSTCKSPQQMFGAIAKTYYAEKIGVDPKNLIVVSIMPCTAKKFEAQRPEMGRDGYMDVDYVLTTRELGRMIREMGIDFVNLPDSEQDNPLGISTGAADIFAASGGVMEAALRTVYAVLTGEHLPKLELEVVRGYEGVRDAEIPITTKEGVTINAKVAIASGTGNARKLLEDVVAGKSPYHFIEIMACPGGCLNGGGQTINTQYTREELKRKRTEAIYDEDVHRQLRESHVNPGITELYNEFLGEPLGHKSHHLLHTHYVNRKEQMENS